MKYKQCSICDKLFKEAELKKYYLRNIETKKIHTHLICENCVEHILDSYVEIYTNKNIDASEQGE
jgi:uncharacterized protein YlaI